MKATMKLPILSDLKETLKEIRVTTVALHKFVKEATTLLGNIQETAQESAIMFKEGIPLFREGIVMVQEAKKAFKEMATGFSEGSKFLRKTRSGSFVGGFMEVFGSLISSRKR